MTTPDYSDLVARLDKLSNGTDLLGRMPSNVDYEDACSDAAQAIETLSAEVERLNAVHQGDA